MRTLCSHSALLALAIACGPEPVDDDGDGVPKGRDCDDAVATVYPGAEERCDGIDNDCDGEIDEELLVPFYPDGDGDGFGDTDGMVLSCVLPAAHAVLPDDCDDGDPSAFPGADETCDGSDNDCDGETDEDDAIDAPTWYADADGDGWGDPDATVTACALPEGAAARADDCDDTDEAVNPDATEVCDGADNDCDGVADEDDAADAPTWWVDQDGDGHGIDRFVEVSCAQPSGYAPAAAGADCDDDAAGVSPSATESCNDIDDDCDGDVDEDDADDASTWYIDGDGDGYGDPATTVSACAPPSGYAATDDDCDDGASDVYPGAPERCDGIDHDCDGDTLEADSVDAATWYADADSDGHGDPDAPVVACIQPSAAVADPTDCDDGDDTIYPGAEEVYYDGVDQDCAADDDWDADGDGWRSQAEDPSGRDCDDADGSVNPDADEVCGNGLDDDCDGTPNACVLSGSRDASAAHLWATGPTASAAAGWSVAGVGDLDGDGAHDLLVGAPGADAGSAYLVMGGVTGTLDLSAADAVLTGADPGDGAGWSVAGSGDLDGDGLRDLIVGAPYAEGAVGAAYVVSGAVTGPIDLSTDPVAAFFGNTANGRAGQAVVGAGDIDADGNADLLVGAPQGALSGGSATGVAWLLLGPLSGVVDGDDAVVLSGSAAWDAAGESVAAAGDVNGDGYEDLLIGGSGVDSGGTNAGAAWLLLGPFQDDLALDDADAVFIGAAGGDQAGRAVAGAGDTDGDGYDEVLLGAPGVSTIASDAGAAYLVKGPVSGNLSVAGADATILGVGDNDALGLAVSAAGDVDGDGNGDVIVGAPGSDAGATDGGAAYLVLGPLTGQLGAASADARVTHTANAALGRSLAPAGDVDGDGTDDLLFGAPGASDDAPAGGAATLFLNEGY